MLLILDVEWLVSYFFTNLVIEIIRIYVYFAQYRTLLYMIKITLFTLIIRKRPFGEICNNFFGIKNIKENVISD